jgi:hypothetical protein
VIALVAEKENMVRVFSCRYKHKKKLRWGGGIERNSNDNITPNRNASLMHVSVMYVIQMIAHTMSIQFQIPMRLVTHENVY